MRPSLLQRYATLLFSGACMTVGTLAQAEIRSYSDTQATPYFSEKTDSQRDDLYLMGKGAIPPSEWGNGRPPAVDADTQDRLAESTAYRSLIQHPNLKKYEKMLEDAAAEYMLDPALLKAVIAAESGFNPKAVSPKGAVGLMQIMPATAQWLGLKGDRKQSVSRKLKDPKTNIRLGARYLKMLTERFPDNLALALAAYNAGEGSVVRYKHTIPPFPETRNYVQVVTQLHDLYQPRPILADTATGEPGRVSLTIPGQDETLQSSGQ